jgi:hypothetical protein
MIQEVYVGSGLLVTVLEHALPQKQKNLKNLHNSRTLSLYGAAVKRYRRGTRVL